MMEGGLMELKQRIRDILDALAAELAHARDLKDLESARTRFLGRKGSLTELLRGMGQIPPAERPIAGQLINGTREKIEEILSQKEHALGKAEREARILAETLDVTEPRPLPRVGSPHPVTLVADEMVDCFVGMGFEVVEGPELELDLYNFELLNIPKNHPARDEQDSFYVDDRRVLRTHTSPVQARTMLTRRPPIRVVCPGRCYRADEIDATHTPVFHQIEGLAIDRDVTMADLRGTLDAFARRLFGSESRTRFRPAFFPFTEPSAEVDITCFSCHGAGCRLCRGSGWIEVLGSGMVNPRVLDLCGIDSAEYSGFAFGIGLERVAMLRYGIADIRLLYEGDERFLSQFR